MSCGVGPGRSSDLVLLWLWCRPAAAALIGPLVWELPCAMVWPLKKKGKERKKESSVVTAVVWVATVVQIQTLGQGFP